MISKGRVFCKIFIPTSVIKVVNKYNNKYKVLDTEKFNENKKIENNNTIISGISWDIQVNKIKKVNYKIEKKYKILKNYMI